MLRPFFFVVPAPNSSSSNARLKSLIICSKNTLMTRTWAHCVVTIGLYLLWLTYLCPAIVSSRCTSQKQWPIFGIMRGYVTYNKYCIRGAHDSVTQIMPFVSIKPTTNVSKANDSFKVFLYGKWFMVPALLKTALKGVLVKVNISHGEKACSIIQGCLKAY